MVEEKGSFVNSDKERGETKRRKLKKNICNYSANNMK
jgi:hypothetical protein